MIYGWCQFGGYRCVIFAVKDGKAEQLGVRFYRAYEYWELGGLTYEALALMVILNPVGDAFALTRLAQAFLNLLLGYLGETSEHHASFMQSQAKTGLPWPFGVSCKPSVHPELKYHGLCQRIRFRLVLRRKYYLQ